MPFDGTLGRSTLEEQLKLIEAATELIRDRDHWCQGTERRRWLRLSRTAPYISIETQYCMIGALDEVGAGKNSGARAAVLSACKEAGEKSIAEANDRTNHARVMAIMGRARSILMAWHYSPRLNFRRLSSGNFRAK